MYLGLRFAFFLSGMAALLFETLWFRQAGLMLGNSVWSSAIVLSSFMAGLAVGNALAARYGERLRRPLSAYAMLETVIAVTGLALVLAFPLLTRWLAPLFSAWLGDDMLLNGARLAVAFGLLLLPASAMGATLPVLVPALGRGETRFGHSLGQLYGWNTLGAVAGAASGELKLIEAFGITGCGALAASLNLVAALVALQLAKRSSVAAEPPLAVLPQAPARPSRLPLAAAFLAGALLLALEVLWFRFLLLFQMGTGLAFAIMLACVLAGIGLGGLIASAWLRRRPDADRWLPAVALTAGVATVWTYAAFRYFPARGAAMDAIGFGVASTALMFPTSLASGLLFTLIGQAFRRGLDGETRAAGILTTANTVGAMLGALLAGLVLLPSLGIEKGLFSIVCGYSLVALGCAVAAPTGQAAMPRWRLATGACAAAFAATLALFPFGSMRDVFLPRVWQHFAHDAVAAWREGVTETVAYLVSQDWDRPTYYRLVTNGHSMSGTQPVATRYMRLFSYLPLALLPDARSALVISFGLGSTLDALLDSDRLESVHVVDISRDILALGRVVYPPPRRYPLDDPRVRTHVEDGRFFLLTTDRRFDIITAEPPPPKNAGIVNLYSKEYFQLLHGRLNPGGMATYWLPVVQLEFDDTRAIMRGFCDVFADCTLWTGMGFEWMLVGTRDGRPASEDGVRALWHNRAARRWLDEMSLHVPEQLGTTFLADAGQLQAWLRGVRPLEDGFPLRLSHHMPSRPDARYTDMLRPEHARERFAQSTWVKEMWPAGLREATLRRFDHDLEVLRYLAGGAGPSTLPALASAAGDPATRTAVLWMMRRSPALEAAARGARERGVQDPQLDVMTGVTAFAEGRFVEAERLFHGAQRAVLTEWIVQWRVLALGLAGDRDGAARLVQEAGDWVQPEDPDGWRFLISTFGLPDPWKLTPATRLGQS